jgi:hypothetical protein
VLGQDGARAGRRRAAQERPGRGVAFKYGAAAGLRECCGGGRLPRSARGDLGRRAWQEERMSDRRVDRGLHGRRGYKAPQGAAFGDAWCVGKARTGAWMPRRQGLVRALASARGGGLRRGCASRRVRARERRVPLACVELAVFDHIFLKTFE